MENTQINPTYCVVWSTKDKRYIGQCIEYPELSAMDEIPELALIGIRLIVAEKQRLDKQNESLAKLYQIQYAFDDELFNFKPVNGFSDLMKALNEKSNSQAR